MTQRQINETRVSEDMYQAAMTLRRRGSKVFLIIGDDRAHRPEHCDNCNGAGIIGLQYFSGGPYEATPSIQNNPPPGQPQNVPARATFYDGKWYKQKTRSWACPLCDGTAISKSRDAGARAAAERRELAF